MGNNLWQGKIAIHEFDLSKSSITFKVNYKSDTQDEAQLSNIINQKISTLIKKDLSEGKI